MKKLNKRFVDQKNNVKALGSCPCDAACVCGYDQPVAKYNTHNKEMTSSSNTRKTLWGG